MQGFAHKKLWFIGIILLVLCIGRIMLPYWAENYINEHLLTIEGYSGQVQDVSLSLLTGQATVYGIQMEKTGRKGAKPIISIQSAQVALNWSALRRGKLETTVILESPYLHFVLEKPQVPAPKVSPSQAWRMATKQLLPLKINQLLVHNGSVCYEDRTAKPVFNFNLNDVELELNGLQEMPSNQVPLPADLSITAKAFNQASLNFDMQFNPQANTPTFKLEAQMQSLQLTQINGFLQRYTKLKAQEGSFSFYLEAAAKQGKITGYIKPFLQDLQAKVPQADQANILKKAYKGVVQAANAVLKNNDTEQVASKLDISGDINGPDVSIWTVVVNLLQNAFIKALIPGIEHSVS